MPVRARAVVLATGGMGQVYASTTNPSVSTGDGVALGLRAGAVATDLEFVQFHPSVAVAGSRRGPGVQQPLVSEALRGEGAVLRDGAGDRFMVGAHPLAELAPRDVVAKAITRVQLARRRPATCSSTPAPRRGHPGAPVPDHLAPAPGGRRRPGDRAHAGRPGRALRLGRAGDRPVRPDQRAGLYACGEAA